MIKLFIFLKNYFYNKLSNYKFSLIIFILLFFISGLITSMNDILIPKLKHNFRLNYFQSMLVQFCFFIAYFIISYIYYLICIYYKNSNKLEYKNIIKLGLIISSIGSYIFYYTSNLNLYIFFLFSLFILASGITLIQISGNPYVTLLGPPETASGRLSLTQAFNSLGSTIAPIIGSKFLLENKTNYLNFKLYFLISIILIILFFLIKIIPLPKIENKIKNIYDSQNIIKKYRHLKYGIIAIFMYVGSEVSINSLIISFISNSNIINISESNAANFLSLYWGGTMIGRFFGAIFFSKIKQIIKILLISIVLFFSFLYSGYILNFNFKIVKYFWGLIIFVMLIFHTINKKFPNKILFLFSIIVIILLLLGVFTHSIITVWSIIGIGLFNSIMFPTIFSLAIRDLKENTSKGSSLLIMAVVGGAIIPPIQGIIADKTNIQMSYLIPIICYIYLLFYGLNGYKKNNNL